MTDRPPVSGEPTGVTEYPSDEQEQLANDLYCVDKEGEVSERDQRGRPDVAWRGTREYERIRDSGPIDVERLKRAMAADEEVFRLLWPDENGLELAADRLAELYNEESNAA